MYVEKLVLQQIHVNIKLGAHCFWKFRVNLMYVNLLNFWKIHVYFQWGKFSLGCQRALLISYNKVIQPSQHFLWPP